MRVKRTDLIQQLKDRRDMLLHAAEQKYAQDVAAEEERREAYRESTRAEWVRLTDTIREACAEGRAVLASDIPDTLRRDGYLGYRPRKVERQRPQVGALGRLIALLEASPDETVSVPSLERAGFSLGTLLK